MYCPLLPLFQEEMADIHYIPDPDSHPGVGSSNNPMSNNSATNDRRFVMPKIRFRRKQNQDQSRRPSKTMEELMRRYQEHVDANALIVFPIAFLLFNIFYWIHYLIFRTSAE